MSKNRMIVDQDLVDNPTIRVPVCLCLDISGSMEGDRINELNKGVKQFYDALKADEMAYYSAEICIVTFGSGGVKCQADYAGFEKRSDPPVFVANGSTPMGEAVNMALDKLEERKEQYKAVGVDYYQPWLVLMTDGRPNGDPDKLETAIKRVNELILNQKLTLFPIGIGSDADMNVLKRFLPEGSPWKLKGLNFAAFFQWLSKSVTAVSNCMPSEFQLDMSGTKGWGDPLQ